MARTTPSKPSDPGDGEHAVDRATVVGKVVTILRAFTVDDNELSLAELVRRTGLHKATVHRLAGELVGVRLLDRTDDGYRLSGGLFELGMLASVERSLLEIAMPFLQDLYGRTRETVHLGVLDGHEVVYVAKIGGHRQASAPSRTGGRMPLHCTGIGKALLAHSDPALQQSVLAGPLPRRTPRTIVAPGILARQLDAIRESGAAFEYEESAPGIACVAAPILDVANNTVVAAVSVTGPLTRYRPEAHTDAVRAAATGIASTLDRRRTLR
ncbi:MULTISPECIES: IclR family transcriptional regulator [Gordonia]|uniref:IclR family transcriptional regulator n=1 Tax=Gordonia cholesterolivorans TaxID=559625 RepID=A0ABN3HP56_9ACTN|nr:MULTISPECIES: IclR family transcriptional regulator [Gordonia]MBY4570665.1 IclR family transcriptional regulator [Gordonia sihwensis]WFN91284.1 IclR family transcriptional regulator [Gordonia sihwensis]